MSRSIPVPKIKTTGRQDVRVICEILRVCERGRVPVPGVGLHLRGVSDVLDGRPVDFDSLDFDEAVRLRSFSDFTRSATSFCLRSKLVVSEGRLIDAGVRLPTEVHYAKVTWFGRLFMKSPYVVQWSLVKALGVSFFAIDTLKKYRWIFSVSSLVAGGIAWVRAHDLSGLIIAVAITAGILAAFAAAWIAHILGIGADDT